MRHHLPFVASAFLCAAPALALDLPPRKPGLWDIKTMLGGSSAGGLAMPIRTISQCVDAATDKLMNFWEMHQDLCSRQDVQKVGNTFVVDTVCKIEAVTITSRGVVTGDFNSSYVVRVTSQREGDPVTAGRLPRIMTVENKWVGPCTAGLMPGDIVRANGTKVNIRDLR